MRCTSKGTVRLRSSNPSDHPLMDPNYLATEDDVVDMRNCVKKAREILAQRSFQPYSGGEILPGVNIQSDAEIDAFVREHGDSAYHPSCTCKMGAEDDPMTVVDSSTKVKGIENLRIVDASIMPSVVSGNLNGPTIMMAEKAADIIRGRKLPRSYAPVYPAAISESKTK